MEKKLIKYKKISVELYISFHSEILTQRNNIGKRVNCQLQDNIEEFIVNNPLQLLILQYVRQYWSKTTELSPLLTTITETTKISNADN